MTLRLAIAAAIVAGTGGMAAAEVPALETPVTDRAGLLSPAEVTQLDTEMVRVRVDTGAQLAVLIVRTTAGVPIEDYASQVADKWGGGSTKRNDGVLLVLAIDDRRSRLDVGYDLEDRLTDARNRQILDAMAPALRSADYSKALLGAIGEVARALAGLEPAVAYQRETPRAARRTTSAGGILIGIVVVVIAVFVIIILVAASRTEGGGGGGGSGAAFAGDVALAGCEAVASSSASSSGWSSGSSGSSWGSGSSGGSSGGGSSPSWGGGGGSFGGGGASSSW